VNNFSHARESIALVKMTTRYGEIPGNCRRAEYPLAVLNVFATQTRTCKRLPSVLSERANVTCSGTGSEDIRGGRRDPGTCFEQILLDLERDTQKAYGSSVRRFRDATIEAECKSDYPHALHLNGVRTLLKDDGGRVRNSGIGQRTLQLGSLSGGVSFFICRLLVYEGFFSTRFSDLPILTDSFIFAESISAGVGLGSAFSLSIDPLQLINTMFSIITIILNSRQVGLYRSENCFHKGHINVRRDVLRCFDSSDGFYESK
jgi:hypothetical protein